MKEIERAREIGMKLMEELAKKAEECSTPSELATIIHAYMELIRVSGVRISDGSPTAAEEILWRLVFLIINKSRIYTEPSPSGKATDFDSVTRGFESRRLSHETGTCNYVSACFNYSYLSRVILLRCNDIHKKECKR